MTEEPVCNRILHAVDDYNTCSYHIMSFNCKGCFCVTPKMVDPGCGCDCHVKVALVRKISL